MPGDLAGFPAVLHPQLFEDIMDVDLDRVLGNV